MIADGHRQIGLVWRQGAFCPKQQNTWLPVKNLDRLDQKISQNSLLKEKYQASPELEKGYIVKVHDVNSNK